MKLVSLMLTEEQIEKLKTEAEKNSVSMSAQLRLVINEYFNNMEGE